MPILTFLVPPLALSLVCLILLHCLFPSRATRQLGLLLQPSVLERRASIVALLLSLPATWPPSCAASSKSPCCSLRGCLDVSVLAVAALPIWLFCVPCGSAPHVRSSVVGERRSSCTLLLHFLCLVQLVALRGVNLRGGSAASVASPSIGKSSTSMAAILYDFLVVQATLACAPPQRRHTSEQVSSGWPQIAHLLQKGV